MQEVFNVFNYFTQDDFINSEKKRHLSIVKSIMVGLTAIPITLTILVLPGSIQNKHFFLHFNILFSLAYFVCLFLLYKGHITVSKTLFLSVTLLQVTHLIWHFGVDNGTRIYYIVIFMMSLIFFEKREIFFRTFFLLTSFLAFVFLDYAVIFDLIRPFDDLSNRKQHLEFYIVNSSICFFSIFLILYYFFQKNRFYLRTLLIEKNVNESILENTLPHFIIQRIKNKENLIADHIEGVSVIFCDIVGFTKLCGELSPSRVISLLNSIFVEFDKIVNFHRAEKIKTIGDAYMIATGLPTFKGASAKENAITSIKIAIKILHYLKTVAEVDGHSITMRIGISTGPCVAGVIGTQKFSYDIWGDTVNLASRMESAGRPSCINISSSTYELVKDNFNFEDSALVNIEGKGPTMIYYLNEEGVTL